MGDRRRDLPSIDRLMHDASVTAPLADVPRSVVVEAARRAVEDVRRAGETEPDDGWPLEIERRVRRVLASSLGPVVNATGVVLHTNLGRAPLANTALDAMRSAAQGYTSLEFDLASGKRGSRHTHCRELLIELTGADDALVVNNAAAALLLALAALADRYDAVVSRGELVEIGGAFRIPDVIRRSGARLVEVGATNRTHLADYERAMTDTTRVILKVHRSNFEVTGFTTEVSATDVAALAREHGVRSVFDLGSGLLADLAPWGLVGEPRVAEAVGSGVDLVLFSGDKLLGGPQAGIALGTAAAIDAMRSHPLARAVRTDKTSLAALEATLGLYRDPDRARADIPVLRMLTLTETELRPRAGSLAEALPAGAGATVVEGSGEVGGGAFPGVALPTVLVVLRPQALAAQTLLERLRGADPPVIARIHDDAVVLDPRTIESDRIGDVAKAVEAAIGLSFPTP